MKVIRTFFPVGHGAFYSERHIGGKGPRDFIVVYDCGTMNAGEKHRNMISAAFDKTKDVVDILFISHFDSDHISLINDLKNSVSSVNTVVLPLLYDDCLQGVMLSVILQVFGSSVQIWFVSKDEERDGKVINADADDDKYKKINSGCHITKDDWVFIPHNVDHIVNKKTLIQKLLSNSIVKQVYSNPTSATLSNISNSIWQTEIKKIYDSIGNKPQGTSNINNNSMLLYSGPLKSENSYKRYGFFNGSISNKINKNAGCIYMGDSSMHTADISITYKAVWGSVGTIQIPHHGSIINFNAKHIKPKCACPISVPTSNKSQRHPSKGVVTDIKAKSSVPVCVTNEHFTVYYDFIL